MMPDILSSSAQSEQVLIVDDHPIVLYGLRLVLAQQGLFTICGEAGNAGEAQEIASRLQPGYIILDLVLGGRDKLDLLRDLVRIAPDARVLVYSSQSERLYARRVLQAGARGYVSKMAGLDTVAVAMQTLLRGEIFISETLHDQLIDAFVNSSVVEDDGSSMGLSERERQVAYGIRNGCSLAEIAGELGLSIKTIGTYRDRLRSKLAAANAGFPMASAHPGLDEA